MSENGAERDRQLAAAVREACIAAALAGYENAGMSGLCHEGRWECAVSAMRVADLDEVLHECAQGTVTLRNSAREPQLNDAVALREYLRERLGDALD